MLNHNAYPISDNRPLYINGLRIFPDRFDYGVISCSFSSVVHVELRQITCPEKQKNKFELLVISKGGEQHLFQSRLKHDEEKLLRGHDYLCQQTYAARMHKYAEQLKKHGKMRYMDCDIYANGTVLKNDKTYSIQHLDLVTGCATVKQVALLGEQGQFHISRDKDVVVALLDHIIKHPNAKATELKNHRQCITHKDSELDILVANIAGLFCKYCLIDDSLRIAQVRHLKQFLISHLKLSKQGMIFALHDFNQANNNAHDFGYYAQHLVAGTEQKRCLRRHIIDALFVVGLKNEHLSASKELLLLKVQQLFKIQSRAYAEYKQNKRSSSDNNNQRTQYFALFGLKQDCSEQDIKTAYKKIVIRFHPDRMHHLGPDMVKKAEEKMKQINQAYAVLLKRTATTPA